MLIWPFIPGWLHVIRAALIAYRQFRQARSACAGFHCLPLRDAKTGLFVAVFIASTVDSLPRALQDGWRPQLSVTWEKTAAVEKSPAEQEQNQANV